MSRCNVLIEEFYIENRKRLVKAVAARCRDFDDAEDIVQEAFCRALKYLDWIDKEDMHRWFHTVIDNAYNDHMRAKRRSGCSDHIEVEEDHTTFEMSEWAEDMVEKLEEEISILQNGLYRQFFYLVLIRQFKPKEAAEVVSVSPVNARKALQRFKEDFVAKYGERS